MIYKPGYCVKRVIGTTREDMASINISDTFAVFYISDHHHTLPSSTNDGT